ncbi:MAG: cytochrome c oxidase subunit II [Chloroflexi bacterium]|nr:cytochrome c oxidase subunit II [Chloroflexota bacterium]
MRHYITVGILVIVAAFGTYFGLDALELMPEAASAQAGPIDWLWNYQVIAISFLFALIVVPLVYSLIVFRRKKGDTSDAEHIEGNTNLEIGWTIAPLFIVMVFAYMGSYSLSEVRRADPQAMIVKVHARQFSWTFEYPEQGGFMSNELHLPVDRQVLLQMDSTDVIHSFWIPEFRVKQDVVPGRVTELRITPTLINLPSQPYKVRCAELCGSAHYSMESKVFVSDESTFQQWAAEQLAAYAAAQTPEAKGELLAKNNGCFGCHSPVGAALVGPTWKGLFGSQVQLSNGTTVTADEAFILDSILNPQATIVAGFEGASAMPAYAFTEEELSYIVAYIMSLK